MPEVDKIIADLAHAFEEFKSTNDASIKEIKKGFTDVVREEKLARINDALDKLTEAKEAAEERADELEAKLNRAEIASGDKKKAPFDEAEFKNHALSAGCVNYSESGNANFADEYKTAYFHWLRKSKEGMSPEEVKTMYSGSAPDGGYLVPPDMSGRIITRLYETSPMRQNAAVVTIGTDALEGLRDLGEGTSGGWVMETETRSATGTPQFGAWRIEVNEQYAYPFVTQKMLDDANINIEAWLSAKVADKMARTENTAFVSGSGIRQPKGFTQYTVDTADDSSRSATAMQYTKTGVNGGFAASNPADILFTIISQMNPAYLNASSWYTKREVIALIRKMKGAADYQYLWQPGLQAGQPSMLVGYPIVMLEDLPALSTNGLSLAFGNMRETYTIVQRQGLRSMRNPFATLGSVGFYTTSRVGGGVVNFNTLKFVKFAA